IMTFYPDGRPNGNNLDMYGEFSIEIIADDTVRIHLQKNKNVKKGELLCLYHKVYGGQAIYFGAANNCSLSDVVIHSFAGMGLVATDRTTNLTVERYRVERPKGSKRLTSTNADGSKFIFTGGLLTIKDCDYEGMGDDAINIHSSFGQIIALNRSDSTLQLMRPHRDGLRKLSNRYLLPGDKIEIYDSKTFLPKGVSTVIQKNQDWYVVDAIPDGVTENDLLNNISMAPRVRISGVSVSRNRARGFLLQSQDVIVEKCRIMNSTGVGIFVTTDVNYWYESGPGKNIVIRNNVIEGANNHLIMEGAINVKCSHDSGGTDYPAGVHRNIKITGNTIRNTSGSGIFVSATDGVVVTGNTIENCSLNTKLPNSDYAVFIKNCRNVAVSDNTVINGKKNFGSEGIE
ncbi:right-handed parallel beta-helix repeat-containing protein, partial [bacterium]|nr:right-handed parallel beta-helix repeat-containing protein [bacterium]